MSVLFLLAGYPGAGKSSLLHLALQRRFPLFGPGDHDVLFQRTRLPSRVPEWSLSFEEVLREGTWFSRTHVEEFGRLARLPDAVVMHVDLLNFCGRRPDCPDEALASMFPRAPASLQRDEDNLRVIASKLAHPFFARFDRVLVHTVHAPWSVCSERWRAREGARQTNRPNTAAVMLHQDPGEAVHASVYRSWRVGAAALKPWSHLLGDNAGRQLRLRPIDDAASLFEPAHPGGRAQGG